MTDRVNRVSRTMAQVAARYDSRREEILAAIRDKRVSASMSGIEYYEKPWAELDLSDDIDLLTINTKLTWDGEKHDMAGLRRYSPDELNMKSAIAAPRYAITFQWRQ